MRSGLFTNGVWHYELNTRRLNGSGMTTLLTPRQALAIRTQLDMWQDLFLGPWLESSGASGPLYTVSPFDSLDPRVMVYVNDNKAWAYLARQRCIAVRDEMGCGLLPFDRAGCFFDEVLMALVIDWLEETYDDDVAEGAFNGLPSHRNDGHWNAVSDAFDNAARWAEWDVPAIIGHPLLPAMLAERHHSLGSTRRRCRRPRAATEDQSGGVDTDSLKCA